jgi:hypothetical protein
MKDGGIICPKVPLEAIVPHARLLLYPAFSMRGSVITVIITTEAETIPVEAAKIAPTKTTLTPSPPLTLLNIALIEMRSFSAMPDFSSINPIAIKRGTAISVELLIIPKILNGRILNTSKPRCGIKKANIIATPPKENATGIPTKRRKRAITNITKAIIIPSTF